MLNRIVSGAWAVLVAYGLCCVGIAEAQIGSTQGAVTGKAVIPAQPRTSGAYAPEIVIYSRATMRAGTPRIGVTHGPYTAQFKTTPMPVRDIHTVGPTQAFGTGHGLVEQARIPNSIVRANSPMILGYSTFTRAPHMKGPTGLSDLHTPNRAFSSFRPSSNRIVNR